MNRLTTLLLATSIVFTACTPLKVRVFDPTLEGCPKLYTDMQGWNTKSEGDYKTIKTFVRVWENNDPTTVKHFFESIRTGATCTRYMLDRDRTENDLRTWNTYLVSDHLNAVSRMFEERLTEELASIDND